MVSDPFPLNHDVLIFYSILGAVAMVLSIALCINHEEFIYERSCDSLIINMSHMPYVFDHRHGLKSREEALVRYKHVTDKWKVEKRSNLSLGEFWDLYDGKW